MELKKKTKVIIAIPVVLLLIAGSILIGFFILATPTEAIGGKLVSERMQNGVYEGHFRGGFNRAHVEVTISDGRIAQIKVLKHVGSWIGAKAVDETPRRIIAAQSTDVDAVTGATFSSRVIMNAVEDAVQKSYSE